MPDINSDAVRREFAKRFAIEQQEPGKPSDFPCRNCGARPSDTLGENPTPIDRAMWYAGHACPEEP